jgi:hypothetical protein
VEGGNFGCEKGPYIRAQPADITLPVKDDFVSDPVLHVAGILFLVTQKRFQCGFNLKHGSSL